MIRALRLGTCIGILVASAASAQVTVEDAVDALQDAAITARIETMFLLNRHLSPFDINTNTSAGVVTLTGGVRDEIQKDLAEELAASIRGVFEVLNRITIVPAPALPKEKRTWKQRIEDRSIKASVRTRLLYHKAFKGLRVAVLVRDGVVTLSGLVPSEQHKEDIAHVAYQTRGVETLINNIVIGPKQKVDGPADMGREISDEWIEKRVETSIALNRHVSIRRVDVEVNDRVCILTGIVDSEPEKELAGAIAGSILGVHDVRNELQVRGGPPKPFAALEPTDTFLEPETHAQPVPARPGQGPRIESTPLVPESGPPSQPL